MNNDPNEEDWEEYDEMADINLGEVFVQIANSGKSVGYANAVTEERQRVRSIIQNMRDAYSADFSRYVQRGDSWSARDAEVCMLAMDVLLMRVGE